ncbi:DUF2490 domain-containing protein [Legionella sp. 227]|uniref:DUF2490 domain-containing protein n=1 Tax=Legionella sp. 227 TaxID=3367288 RepID=UPI00370D1355
MQRKSILSCFFIGMLIFSWSTVANCALERDFQTWFNITAIGKSHSDNKFLSRLRYWLEDQERLGDDSSRFSQILLRPGLGYALTDNLSIWIGYAWIYTGKPNTPNPFEEDRIWQQLLWTKTNQYLTFTSRTRAEQRFLENNPKTAFRLRQLIKISFPFKHFDKMSFVTSDEVFFHKNNFVGTNSSGFDQNRYFVGLGYKINPLLNTEIGYMNQYIRRFGVPDFLANIVSLNFFLNF